MSAKCSDIRHARTKADPDLFLACPFVGIQRIEGWACMLRNCGNCGSTLAMPMAKVMELYPLVEFAEVVQ